MTSQEKLRNEWREHERAKERAVYDDQFEFLSRTISKEELLEFIEKDRHIEATTEEVAKMSHLEQKIEIYKMGSNTKIDTIKQFISSMSKEVKKHNFNEYFNEINEILCRLDISHRIDVEFQNRCYTATQKIIKLLTK